MEPTPNNNLNIEGKMLKCNHIVEDNNVLLTVERKPSGDESQVDESDSLATAQDITTVMSEECDIDGMCQKLECPFTWKSDVEVKNKEQGQVFDNIVDILTAKESEFSQAEHNLFREIVVYLVLSYHKSVNRQLISGAKDLHHCFKIICSEQDMFEKNNNSCSTEPELSPQKTNVPLSENLVKDFPELKNTELKNCKPDKIENIIEGQILFQDVDLTFSERSIANTLDSQHHEENIKETSLFGNLLKLGNFCEWKKNDNTFNNFFNDCKLNLYSNTESELKFGMPKQKSGINSKPQWNGKESKDRLFALQYVVAASLVYYCRMFGLINDAFKIARAIVKLFEEMNPVSKATIFALRGAILCEYGYVGNSLGLQWLKEAQSLDPDYWEWNLYCGKVLGRVRRNENSPSGAPTEEEINFLKKAIELNPNNASALVNLANIYRALASILYRNSIADQSNSVCGDPSVTSRLQGNWRKTSHGLYRGQREPWRSSYVFIKSEGVDNDSHLSMAKELYLKALQIEPNCPYNSARCAKGLWSMPNPYRDKETAQKAILHSLTLAQDDSLVNHYAGMFYEYCRDYEKALKCYEVATRDGRYNFPAELNYINLRLKMSSPASYSPVFKFGILLYKYSMPNNKIQTLCTRGYYFYKVEGAFIQAIRNFTAAIEVSPESSLLLQFYPGSFFKPFHETINVYDILEEVLDQFKRDSDSGATLIIKHAEEALKHKNNN